ncbi:MAG: NADPH-dependent 7-cyano-7-deazaguanine reductase QueF [Rickettsiales bacterium]|nr:NADPH-dependent 7-cyano-7-deazaguanine reductase QueF [Rickettsiales bacterium]
MMADLSPLGKKSTYVDEYDNSLIFPIERATKRKEIGINKKTPPFYGYDIFNAYELSWLALNGRPEIATAEIIYSCRSEYLVESKSLKLYLNSFNNTVFDSLNHVEETIKCDLSNKLKTDVLVKLIDINQQIISFLPEGENIDEYYNQNSIDPTIGTINGITVKNEKIYSNLLKSNCPVTFQPDWGTLMITYTGAKINRCTLLNYILSLRNLNEFHEQCIEKIYMEIDKSCKPDYLQVYGRYTRRGGIDINPYRSTMDYPVPANIRTFRQ